MRWLEAWTRWNAGEYDARIEVAKWHRENGRMDEAIRLFEEANEVDMFRRDLHLAWAEALEAEGRFGEAAREYRVALIVPPRFDPDHIVYIGPPDRLPMGVNPRRIPPGLLGQIPEESLEAVPLGDEKRAEIEAAIERCRAAGAAEDGE